MQKGNFKALIVRKSKDSKFTFRIGNKDINELKNGDLLIRVFYTSINYKDGMSCLGNPSITRRYPHTPGVDAAGIVETSECKDFKYGDKVFIIGYPLGMNVSGGFGEYIKVPSSWVRKIDFQLSFEEVMAYGTAGYTAALAIQTLLNIQSVNNMNSIVSGISGGCGCITAAILKKLGSKVSGISHSISTGDEFAEILGIDEILNSSKLIEESKQNLAIPKWDIGFDYVGGDILSSILKYIKIHGNVATAGMVSSTQLYSSILPFIIRGISLHGINAEEYLKNNEDSIWHKLSNKWKPTNLKLLYQVINLEKLPEFMHLYIEGKINGRVVVKHDF